jgi:hypothetical protein
VARRLTISCAHAYINTPQQVTEASWMGNPLHMSKALSDSHLECDVPCVCPRCRTRTSGGLWNPQLDTPERTCPSGYSERFR